MGEVQSEESFSVGEGAEISEMAYPAQPNCVD